MGARVRNIMPQRGSQLLAVVGEDLRVIRAARYGNVGYAVAEQQAEAPCIGCNGIHYDVIFRYGYCYCKEIEGLYDQPAARTCTKG